MAGGVAGVGAWDEDHEQARIPDGAVRLERDRVTSVRACVRFHNHDWLLSWLRHRVCERWGTSVGDMETVLPGSGCAAGRPAGSAFAGLVISRVPRPRVVKPMDQRMRTRRRFWKPTR